jgi:hypothetical protein
MNQKARFPYRLDNAFFMSLEVNRLPQMPDRLDLGFGVQIRVVEEKFPDVLQVDIRLETLEDQPLTVQAHLVGLFSLVDGVSKPARDIIPSFVNNQALHALWPYMAQMLRIVTGQMGTNPIDIKTPYEFQTELPDR